MTSDNDNEKCTYGIEKFEGDFDKETFGVTIIPNKSINEIRNPEALGLYVYLLARPHGWKLNVFQLKEHFQCNKDKIYQLLHYLMKERFISKNEIRSKGKFVKHMYRVHLGRYGEHINVVDQPIDQPETQAQPESSPLLDLPDLAEPDLVNPDAYKTKNIENKDYNKKPIVDSSKSTAGKSYLSDELFMSFYTIYPNKQKPQAAYRAYLKYKPDQDFVDMLIHDLQERMAKNWKGRHKTKIPFPSRYLNDREWEGELYDAEATDAPRKQSTNGYGAGTPADGSISWT